MTAASPALAGFIIACGVCVLAAMLRWRRWPLSVGAELLTPAMLGLAIAFVVAARMGAVLPAIAAAVLFAIAVVPLTRVETAPRASAPAQRLRIAHANLWRRPHGARRYANWATRRDADVIAVTEMPGADVAKMAAYFPGHPHVAASEDSAGLKCAIFSRYPFATTPTPERNVLRVVLRFGDDTRFTLSAAHPTVPLTPTMQARRDGILDLLFERDDGPAAVIGDLNAAPWGPRLAGASSRSAFRRVGRGVVAQTWMLPLFGLGLPIDHIYVSRRCAVVSAAVGPFIGSDHRPIFAEISW